MKILLSMPNDSFSNNYIINALQDMGHEVFFIDHRKYLEHCHKVVPQFLKHEKIDMMLVLFLVPTKTYNVDYLRQLKANFPNVKYVSWIYDATIDGKRCDENKDFVDIVREYDCFFTVCRGQVESFKKQGVNAHFLREGFDHYTLSFGNSLEKKYDVSFIGQIGHGLVHKERLPILKRITQKYSKSIIYGPIYTEDEEIFKHHSKRPTFNDVEHSRIVGQTKINLGISGWPDIDGYFSARNYRIMGSGGFLLANKSKGIEEVFEDKRDIVLYSDTTECIKLIDYYLEHEEERIEIAKNGYKKVRENFSFVHSFEKMFAITGEDHEK
jgi:spore maturation protein CgeB